MTTPLPPDKQAVIADNIAALDEEIDQADAAIQKLKWRRFVAWGKKRKQIEVALFVSQTRRADLRRQANMLRVQIGLPVAIPSSPAFLTDSEKAFYEYTAHQIEREDGLVNSRLTWMLTTQGFLFAALALIAETGKVPERTFLLLIELIPTTGLSLAILGFTGVVAANIAIFEMKRNWNARPYAKIFPRPFGRPIASWLGVLPSIFLPIVLGVIWWRILVML